METLIDNHLNTIVLLAKDYFEAEGSVETATVVEKLKAKCLDYGKENAITDNDLDFAYLFGIFNAVGIDGLSDELNRLKSLNTKPHLFIRQLKNNLIK